MAALFDSISKVSFNRECIRLLVRVVRMWSVPMFNNPTQVGSLEMILMDEQGCKIQATVRKPLLHKFSSVIEEGSVYKMTYFNVVANSGHYRPTFHEFKLIFVFKTSVLKKDCDIIPKLGLNLLPFSEVFKHDESYEHLIDVIGLLTAVHPERQYEKDGKMTSMVVMELTDSNGKLECALFGEYVDQLRKFLLHEGGVQNIVVVQLARVKKFRGNTVIQNSMNATKLLFNPDIEEALAFRNGIAEHGFIDVDPLSMVLDNSLAGLENEFIKMHPKKSISDLNDLKEDGMFVVVAQIVEMVKDGPWFYLACKCNKAVTTQSGVHYCDTCRVPVLQVFPRYKVKVEVADDRDSAVLVLFDRDMNLLLKKTCQELLTLSFEHVSEDGYPELLDCVVGRKMLFKVESKVKKVMQFDDSFAVRKICVDEHIIALFELTAGDTTPAKGIFAPPFPKVGNEEVDIVGSSTQIESCSFVTPLSLGGDDVGTKSKFTPLKRKLEDEFGCSQEDGSINCVKSNSVAQDSDDVVANCCLLPVQMNEK